MSGSGIIRNYLFHRVSPDPDISWSPLKVEQFERCIKYISTHYEIITVEQLPARKNRQAHRPLATITFDDGYRDNIEYALPILDRYNIKASFYVVTDCIDKNIPTWTHLVEYLLMNSQKNTAPPAFQSLPQPLRKASLSSYAERKAFARRLIPHLKTLMNKERLAVVDAVTAHYNDVAVPSLMMNWDDLRSLYAQGHYIGSHTVTHSMLERIEQEEEIRSELEHSGNRIRHELGYFPTTIAYPIGNYNSRVIGLAKECGYTIGLATKQYSYNPAADDIFEIPRIELLNESWFKTVLRISNRLEVIKKSIFYRVSVIAGLGFFDFNFD